MSALPRIRTFLFWFLSLAIALASWRWLALGVELSMPPMFHHVFKKPVALYVHIFFAPVALALMPFQFWAGLRNRRPAVHRWLGRGYGMAILFSGTGGFFIALNTNAGPVAASGFALLAVLWLATTARGIQLAMARRIAEHRRWMIRSAALTFAAVTLRLYLPLLAAAFGFETGYPIVAWLCWVPNLLIAEWLLLRPQSRLALTRLKSST
ncbi:DUF2306 domain-containing protein [Pseudoruegeria sp. HB172150]|uniref:DUF2306 domain-containing protein n=1 Tax=Pseudoruegeria sp. HB172150 TaxID=2721164 RepID=UPI0015531681|nr:DUF2306 domain-containing protein [Pseudoruegeria sp. HB172150]